jgi:hypothetical protein
VLICSNMAVAGDFTPVLALEIVLLDRLHLGRRGSCSGTSNQSRAGGSMAEERIDGRDREGGHLQGLRGRYWKPRNTLPASSTTCTSIRSTRSSGRGPSGVWRMRSRQPSRNSTRFPDLGRRRSWESSWTLGSRKLFEEAWSYAPKSQSSIIPFCLAGVARRLTPPQTIDFPEARFSTASEALKSFDYFGIAAWSWAMPHIAKQMLSGLCAIYVIPARKSARGRDYRVRCPPGLRSSVFLAV